MLDINVGIIHSLPIHNECLIKVRDREHPKNMITIGHTISKRRKQIEEKATSLTLSLSPTDLSTETSFDGSDGTTRSARVAGDEVQTIFTLVEFSIGTAAGLAGDVFDCDDRVVSF